MAWQTWVLKMLTWVNRWRGWRESKFWRGCPGPIKFRRESKKRLAFSESKFWRGWRGIEVFS